MIKTMIEAQEVANGKQMCVLRRRYTGRWTGLRGMFARR